MSFMVIFFICTKPLRGSFGPRLHNSFGLNCFFDFICSFLTGAVNSLFTDINDHAMLIAEIIMKRESGYFTHIAFLMPE